MSGTSEVFWPAGPTVALSVVATSHAAVPLTLFDNTAAFWVALVNTGAVPIAVELGVAGDAAILPVDGVATGNFVVDAGARAVLPLPSGVLNSPCQITAIATAAGPSVLYATPLVMQR